MMQDLDFKNPDCVAAAKKYLHDNADRFPLVGFDFMKGLLQYIESLPAAATSVSGGAGDALELLDWIREEAGQRCDDESSLRANADMDMERRMALLSICQRINRFRAGMSATYPFYKGSQRVVQQVLDSVQQPDKDLGWGLGVNNDSIHQANAIRAEFASKLIAAFGLPALAASPASVSSPQSEAALQARAAELRELADGFKGELGSWNPHSLMYCGFMEACKIGAARSLGVAEPGGADKTEYRIECRRHGEQSWDEISGGHFLNEAEARERIKEVAFTWKGFDHRLLSLKTTMHVMATTPDKSTAPADAAQ